jgi:hypothetical protein
LQLFSYYTFNLKRREGLPAVNNAGGRDSISNVSNFENKFRNTRSSCVRISYIIHERDPR